MATSMGSSAARTHQKSLLDDVVAGKANVRIDLKSAQKTPELKPYRSLVREAMRTSRLSQKEFAIDAGVTESAVSDALAGARLLPSEWVWAQTHRGFREELRAIEARERGLTIESQREYRTNLIIELVRQLLLSGERREERAS